MIEIQKREHNEQREFGEETTNDHAEKLFEVSKEYSKEESYSQSEDLFQVIPVEEESVFDDFWQPAQRLPSHKEKRHEYPETEDQKVEKEKKRIISSAKSWLSNWREKKAPNDAESKDNTNEKQDPLISAKQDIFTWLMEENVEKDYKEVKEEKVQKRAPRGGRLRKAKSEEDARIDHDKEEEMRDKARASPKTSKKSEDESIDNDPNEEQEMEKKKESLSVLTKRQWLQLQKSERKRPEEIEETKCMEEEAEMKEEKTPSKSTRKRRNVEQVKDRTSMEEKAPEKKKRKIDRFLSVLLGEEALSQEGLKRSQEVAQREPENPRDKKPKVPKGRKRKRDRDNQEIQRTKAKTDKNSSAFKTKSKSRKMETIISKPLSSQKKQDLGGNEDASFSLLQKLLGSDDELSC